MAKKQETKKPKTQKYSKEAFLSATQNSNERILLDVLLQDGESYAKTEVEKLVKGWKAKSIKKKGVK